MTSNHKPRIGISIGDLNGIGPEVILKALTDHRIYSLLTPVIYGAAKVITFYKKQLGLEDFNYSQVRNRGQYAPKTINVVNCWEDQFDITPGKASAQSGKASFQALKQACEDLKDGHIDALVTAPIDKHSIHSEEFPFTGHTEFITRFFGATDSLMFMVSDALRVGLVTEHVPVKDIAALITKEKLEVKLKLMEHSLKNDFGVSKPRIAVLGLNPHAGDGGLIGNEDEQVIKPVVNDLRNKGKLVYGPYPADGFFASGQYQKFDGILAMYHDQGLVGFKTISFENGINFTAGLSVVRTSPDHGTAYQLAGKNQANENSFREALYKATEILKTRIETNTEKEKKVKSHIEP
jgi:4-hydroxythreonine-4-phosphate dehydrogenase